MTCKKSITILTIIGARPQFVKAAVLSRFIKKKYLIENKKIDLSQDNHINSNVNMEKSNLRINEFIVHTGQHYDKNMSQTFFEQMGIPEPDINLGLGGGTHGQMTGKMMIEFEKIVFEKKPDFILIYGDTNSTLAGALVGAKLHIPVIHVEAGLRSFDKSMPEEINRVLSDHVSKYLFCPTQTAILNLKKEGIYDGKIEKGTGKIYVKNVGDIMYEAFNFYKQKVNNDNFVPNIVVNKYFYNFKSNKFKINENIDKIHKNKIVEILLKEGFNLLTLHRDFNVDSPEKLKTILKAISGTDNIVVFPIHPRTLKRIEEFRLKNYIGKNTIVIEPVGYFEMLWLELNAKKIITDSGGVQKEAYFARKPCITLRDHTEWVELVKIGANVLCNINLNEIKDKINNFKCSDDIFNNNLYGDGKVAEKIIKWVVK